MMCPVVEVLEARTLLSAGGLSIVLQKGPNLSANAAASAAADQAALFIESLFADPITVVVDAEITSLPPGTIARCQPVVVDWDYADLLARMKADATLDEPIVQQIPALANLNTLLPAGFSLAGAEATRANLLALGVDYPALPQVSSAYAPGAWQDMTLYFSDAITYDYTRADGIDFGAIDFKGEVIHEMVHGLGFSSGVSTVDRMLRDGQSGPVRLDPMDLFRLAPGEGAANFVHTQRLLVPGAIANQQVFYDGGTFDPTGITGYTGLAAGDIPMSTGVAEGDGHQPAHWKDQAYTGRYIGLMEPTSYGGELAAWTEADTRALSLVGWDIPELASITGRIFNDLNANGIVNVGEPPIPAWSVFLDTNNNGQWNAGEPTTLTDAQGVYQFTNLRPGTYHVGQQLKEGWFVTGNPTQTVAVAHNQPVIDVNLSVSQPGSVAGRVYVDMNGDGLRQTEEPPIATWSVYADLDRNGRWDAGENSAVTDVTGRYVLQNMSPGDYQIGLLVAPHWRATNGPLQVTVFSGQMTGRQKLFAQPLARVQGKVYYDANTDGIRQASEIPLTGTLVWLDTNLNQRRDSGEAMALTDATGKYVLDDLVPGYSTLAVALPPSWAATSPWRGVGTLWLNPGQIVRGWHYGLHYVG